MASLREQVGEAGPGAAARGASFVYSAKEFVRLGRRQAVPLAVALGVALPAGLIYYLTRVPSYVATTVLLIDQRKVRAVQDAQSFEQFGGSLESSLSSQIEVMRSEKVAQWVLAHLPADVGADTFFAGRGPIANILAKIRYPLGLGSDEARRGAEPTPMQQRQMLYVQLRDGLKVSRIGRTQLIEISYTALDPVRASRVANVFGDAFIAEQVEARTEAITRAGAWLRGQLDDLKLSLQRAEQAVQKYKADRGLVSAGGRLLDDQKLGDISTQLTTLKAETFRLEARYAKVKEALSTNRLDPGVLEAIGSTAVEQNRAKYIVAERGEREISRRLGPGHAAALRLRSEMQDYQKLTLQELGRLSESLRNELEIQKSREKSVLELYNSMAGTNTTTNETLIELRELERTAETYKAIYSSALQRNQEAIQQQSFPAADVHIVAKAAPPTFASSTSLLKALLYSLLFGGMAGGAVGMLRELLDESFRTRRQAEQLLHAGPVQMLPRVVPEASGPEQAAENGDLLGYVNEHPRSQLAEQLQALKVMLAGRPEGKPARVVGIVSIVPGEGASTLAKGLASSLARMGATTLLIDADLRSPSLSHALAGQSREGLIEAVRDGAIGPGRIVKEAASGLSILPVAAGSRFDAPLGILTAPGFAKLIQQARASYDHVLIDLPALAICPDAEAIAAEVDGFLLVVEWGRTSRQLAADALDQHPAVHGRCLGVLLNKTDWSQLKLYEAYDPQTDFLQQYGAFRAASRPSA